ncbi:MAG: hypothetical protein AAF585_07850 [Verrucomicrobiota bacterium]
MLFLMSVADVERAALGLPQDELIDLIGRLYRSVNRPNDPAAAERIALADERERASNADPNGDSSFDEFIDDLKTSQ